MRKLLMICAVASVFAACNSKTDTDLDTKKDVIVQDTSAMYHSNGSTDTANRVVTNAAPPVAAPTTTTTKTVTRTRTVYVDRPRAPQNNVQRPAPSTQVNTVPQSTTTTTGSTTTTGNGNTTTTGTTTTTTPVAPQKKGWSSAAKDAAIGGVGGAIGGAVLSKNKGKGAIIGGVIGAAGGYILGRKKDKKDTLR